MVLCCPWDQDKRGAGRWDSSFREGHFWRVAVPITPLERDKPKELVLCRRWNKVLRESREVWGFFKCPLGFFLGLFAQKSSPGRRGTGLELGQYSRDHGTLRSARIHLSPVCFALQAKKVQNIKYQGLRHLSHLHQNELTVPLEMRGYELVCGVQPGYLDCVLDPDSWNTGLLVSKHLHFSGDVLGLKFYSYHSSYPYQS